VEGKHLDWASGSITAARDHQTGDGVCLIIRQVHLSARFRSRDWSWLRRRKNCPSSVLGDARDLPSGSNSSVNLADDFLPRMSSSVISALAQATRIIYRRVQNAYAGGGTAHLFVSVDFWQQIGPFTAIIGIFERL